MFKNMKYILLALSTILFFSACTTSSKSIKVIDKETGKEKTVIIFEEIEVKLINDYDEIYDIEDVIIGYKTTKFNPFDSKIISDSFTSTNKKFNSLYLEFSKNGIEKDLSQNEFMTFSDDSILGILAREYGMKVVTANKKNNTIKELDYKKIDINFSNLQKHSLYNGFVNTIKHYNEQIETK